MHMSDSKTIRRAFRHSICAFEEGRECGKTGQCKIRWLEKALTSWNSQQRQREWRETITWEGGERLEIQCTRRAPVGWESSTRKSMTTNDRIIGCRICSTNWKRQVLCRDECGSSPQHCRELDNHEGLQCDQTEDWLLLAIHASMNYMNAIYSTSYWTS